MIEVSFMPAVQGAGYGYYIRSFHMTSAKASTHSPVQRIMLCFDIYVNVR